MPKRVQMHRRKGGWRKDHPDAVIVQRGTKWGNPWMIGEGQDRGEVVFLFQEWMEGRGPDPMVERPDVSELRGKDLACWCPLDQPCHADVLLRLANE